MKGVYGGREAHLLGHQTCDGKAAELGDDIDE